MHIHIQKYTHTHIFTRTVTHTHTPTHTHTNMYAHTNTHIHTQVQARTHTSTHTQSHTNSYKYTYTSVYTNAHYTHKCDLTHMHIHTHTHAHRLRKRQTDSRTHAHRRTHTTKTHLMFTALSRISESSVFFVQTQVKISNVVRSTVWTKKHICTRTYRHAITRTHVHQYAHARIHTTSTCPKLLINVPCLLPSRDSHCPVQKFQSWYRGNGSCSINTTPKKMAVEALEKDRQVELNVLRHAWHSRTPSPTWFLVFVLLFRHTASNWITAETHTSGAQW